MKANRDCCACYGGTVRYGTVRCGALAVVLCWPASTAEAVGRVGVWILRRTRSGRRRGRTHSKGSDSGAEVHCDNLRPLLAPPPTFILVVDVHVDAGSETSILTSSSRTRIDSHHHHHHHHHHHRLTAVAMSSSEAVVFQDEEKAGPLAALVDSEGFKKKEEFRNYQNSKRQAVSYRSFIPSLPSSPRSLSCTAVLTFCACSLCVVSADGG